MRLLRRKAAQAKDEAEAEQAAADEAAAMAAAAAQQEANKIDIDDADKLKRMEEARQAQAARLAEEKAKRDKENAELWKLLHPESEGEEEEFVDEETGETGSRRTVNFFHESSHGHLFTIFHDRKNRPPHDRFVKIDYETVSTGKVTRTRTRTITKPDGSTEVQKSVQEEDESEEQPINISWGSGDSRKIDWKDIDFVIKGCHSATMLIWKGDPHHADEDHVYSIVCKDGRTLDCSASDDHSRDIWLNGITKLLGMTEEERAKRQAEYTPGSLSGDDDIKREKTATQLETQRILFMTQVDTICRELNHEGVYGLVGATVKDRFKNDDYYNATLAKNIAWRNWDTYIRKQIVDYLVEHDVVSAETAATHESEVASARAAGTAPPKRAEPQSTDCLLM
eukprot:TRINITY_DN59_c0_g1_i7.p1 TRINITY_DN59_c0_g1~~TRINITY_DN59_c0_g1_i7.p1  ORF type:complete len:396 (-),score=96.90 TRINITY_DN59_c0_g1_i7:99-1286(-)